MCADSENEENTRQKEMIDLRALEDEIAELEIEMRLQDNLRDYWQLTETLGIKNCREYEDIEREMQEVWEEKEN